MKLCLLNIFKSLGAASLCLLVCSHVFVLLHAVSLLYCILDEAGRSCCMPRLSHPWNDKKHMDHKLRAGVSEAAVPSETGTSVLQNGSPVLQLKVSS